MRGLVLTLCVLGTAVTASACGEEPQVMPAAHAPGAQTDDWREQMRSRTLAQNENRRIYGN